MGLPHIENLLLASLAYLDPLRKTNLAYSMDRSPRKTKGLTRIFGERELLGFETPFLVFTLTVGFLGARSLFRYVLFLRISWLNPFSPPDLCWAGIPENGLLEKGHGARDAFLLGERGILVLNADNSIVPDASQLQEDPVPRIGQVVIAGHSEEPVPVPNLMVWARVKPPFRAVSNGWMNLSFACK